MYVHLSILDLEFQLIFNKPCSISDNVTSSESDDDGSDKYSMVWEGKHYELEYSCPFDEFASHFGLQDDTRMWYSFKKGSGEERSITASHGYAEFLSHVRQHHNSVMVTVERG